MNPRKAIASAGKATNRNASGQPFTSRLLARNDLLGTLFVVILAALLVPSFGTRIRVTKVGDVATRDILAPRDFRVPDEAATERERKKREEDVPLPFSFDPRQKQAAIQTVSKLFAAGRAAIPKIELWILSRRRDLSHSGGHPINASLLQLKLIENIPAGLPDDVLDLFYRHRFAREKEESLARILRAVLGKRIGDLPEEQLARYSGKAILARDVTTGEVSKIRGLEEVFTQDQATRFLATELGQESDIWSRAERSRLLPYLAQLVTTNFLFNPRRYQLERGEARAAVPLLYAEVKKGEKIVGRGDKVTKSARLKLLALANDKTSSFSAVKTLGVLLLLSLFAYGLWRYAEHRIQTKQTACHLYAMLILAFLSSALTVNVSFVICRSLAERFERAPYNLFEPYLYLAPYAVGALLLTLLVGSEIALVFAVCFSLIAGLLAAPDGNYMVALVAIVSGFGAIYFTGPYLKRTTVLKSGLAIGVSSAVAVIAVSFQHGTIGDAPLFLFSLVCAIGSGLLAAMVVQILLPLFESLFGIITDLKLSELMNANHPLISELALRAPGTYNHSLIVGTLAEAAAKAIGANPVFMRAASYYHDIGKMKMPEYFVENQRGGLNRHDKLAPSLSALIVKSHVKDGIELARQHGIPEELIAMIPAHHGTRLLEYFYRKAKQLEDSDVSPVKEEEYRYPGPRPRSREGGIMMMADAVEAAARSLKNPTSQRFENVIAKMTETIFLDGQLDETDLTFNDLLKIRTAFHAVLLSIHHHRVSYPGFDFTKRTATKTPNPAETGHKPASQSAT